VALRACTGFEFGTTAGWLIGNAANKIFDAVTGAPTITTSTPRSGTYCLEVAPSASIVNLEWTTGTLVSSQLFGRVVFAFRFVGSLPSGGTKIAAFTANFNAEISYNQATGKIAAGWETESAVDGPTISADTWYVVEMQAKFSATKAIDWWVDGAAQTQVTSAGAAGTVGSFMLGSYESETHTIRFDDVVCYTDNSAIAAIGPHKVVILKPDTGGSLDVATITTSEWNTFAGSTPTLTAWNATTALGAIDEIPVGLGASADGFCRITGTDFDYVGIPMTSYTLAGGETVSGLRMLACCWAASTTTCTHSFASYNGTTATTLWGAADVGADNSATAPAWVCRMAALADFNTQGELDALQFRFGSTDSTPDAGIHAIYAELAVKEATGAATATPAAVASTTTVPKPDVSVAATPAAVASTGAVPTPAVSVAATLASIAAVAAVPTPAVSVAAAPAAVAAVVSLPTPTAGEAGTPVTVTPAVVAAVAALPQVTVDVGAAPAALAAVASVPTPTIAVAAAPAAVAALAAVPRPTVGVAATPASVAASAALAKPNIGVGAAPAALAAIVELPTPTIPGAGDATPAPAAVASTAALPKPNVSVGAGPASVAALSGLPQPAVAVGARPNLVPLTAALPAPTIAVHGQPNPATVTALVALPKPAVSIQALPAAIMATVTLPTPLIPAPFEPMRVAMDSPSTARGTGGTSSAGGQHGNTASTSRGAVT